MLLLAIAAVILAAPALAFHDDGVAHCDGCHTMHNSQNGVPVNYASDGTIPGTPYGSGWNDLLLWSNATDVCLGCHGGDGNGYHVWATDVLAPNSQNGAGDFVFLEEDNINDGHGGASNPILGNQAGHSVVSVMMGTGADPDNAVAPGGAYPSGDLACTSCHDPHGTDGFRLLYRAGQTTTSSTGYVVNWTDTVVGIGKSLFGPGESDTNHNAIQSGYSSWCASCHGLFHQASGSDLHPAGENLTPEVVAIYNQYTGSEDCAGVVAPCGTGVYATAFWAQVPFQDPDMNSTGWTAGADSTNSRVMCASCHRSHATSAPDAGRWDFSITGMEEDGAESGSYKIPNPYGVYQRSLCNKCHARDEFDALVDFTPAP
jgi:predicted CXXCH cytochrome family protein